MPTAPVVLTPDARRTSNRLLDVLQRDRIAAATDPSGLGPCEIHAKLALIEQAKGALMLHYGIDSHQAFAVLVGWARMTHTPLPTIAHTLLRGISEGNRQTEIRQRALLRWLEAQLRDRDLGPAQLLSTLENEAIAIRHMRLRARDECGNGGVQGRATHADTRPCTTPPPPRGAEPCRVDDLSR